MHFFPNGAFSFSSLGAAPPDWLRTHRLGQPRAASGGRPRSHSRPGLRDAVCTPIPTSVRCTAARGGRRKQRHGKKYSNTIAEGAAFSPGVPGQRLPVDLGRHSVWGAVWVLRSGEQRRDRRCGLVGGAVVLRCCGVLVPVALQEREGKGGHDLCVRGLLKCAGLSRGSTGGCRRPPGVCVGAQRLPTGSPYCAAPSDTGIPGDEGRTDGRVQCGVLRRSRGLQLLSRSQLFFLSFFFSLLLSFFHSLFFFLLSGCGCCLRA